MLLKKLSKYFEVVYSSVKVFNLKLILTLWSNLVISVYHLVIAITYPMSCILNSEVVGLFQQMSTCKCFM